MLAANFKLVEASWLKGVELFSFDNLIWPFNWPTPVRTEGNSNQQSQGYHWSTYVLRVADATLEYYDSLQQSDHQATTKVFTFITNIPYSNLLYNFSWIT